MNKTAKYLLCFFTAMILLCLSGCRESEKRINGVYHAQSYTQEAAYEFDDEGNVTLTISSLGSELFSQNGTYRIYTDDNLEFITLTFATEEIDEIPWFHGSTFSYGGTFDFAEGENYVVIGTVRYDKFDGRTGNTDLETASTSLEKQMETLPEKIGKIR